MIRCRIWTGALLAAAVLAGCDGPRPSSPRQTLEQRRAELQAAAGAEGPQAIAAQVELARIATRLGDGVAAEAAVRAAIAAGGNEAALRPLLARAYAMQGDGTRALQTIDAGPIIPEMIGEAAWVAGDTNASRAARYAVSWDLHRAAEILRHVGESIDHAHSAESGVTYVHRDFPAFADSPTRSAGQGLSL